MTIIARCFSKLFALDRGATPVEYGVIVAILLTALLSTLLAMEDSLAAIYSTVVGDVADPRG
jgi:Flp pilus assembly pilin Flp